MEKIIVQEEIDTLLDLGVLVRTERHSDQVFSPIFLRPKLDGGYRLVLYFTELNKSVPYKHFKMENFCAGH